MDATVIAMSLTPAGSEFLLRLSFVTLLGRSGTETFRLSRAQVATLARLCAGAL